MNNIYISILLILLNSYNIQSQNHENSIESKPLALDPAVRYGKLDNGFTYYLRKNDSPNNLIELHMVVKAGRFREDEDQKGYSHLMEHMGVVGTKHFPDVKKYFRTSGRLNHAYNSHDHTLYYAVIPSGKKEVVQAGLQVVRDWAQDINLDQESIDVQRGAVLGEMRTSDPYRRWAKSTIEGIAVKNTGFKQNDLEIEKDNIENFNREAFLRYYKDWYRPDLEAAIIVGDIDVDSIEVQVRRLFSDLKMPKRPKEAQERVDAQKVVLSGKNQFTTIVDTVHPDFRLNILLKRPNYQYNIQTRGDYKKMLLQKLYKSVLSRKSQQLEQQFEPPFSKLSVNYNANQTAAGQISTTLVNVKLEPENPEQMKNSFLSALLSWKQMHKGITKKELKNAKAEIWKSYANDESLKTANIARRYIGHFVMGTAAPEPESEKKIIEEILNGITLEETRNFFNEQANFKKNTDFIFFKGKDDPMPNYSTFKTWIAEADIMHVKPLTPLKPPIKSLASVAKIPSTDVKEQPYEISENQIGVSTISLPNGIKLVLKPTKPRSAAFTHAITINAFRPNKIPTDDRMEYLTGSNYPNVLKYTGAGPYDKFELERFLQEKGMRLRFTTNKDFQQIRGKTKLKDLDELLNLLYLFIDQPRKDSLGFTAWKENQAKRLKGGSLRGSSEFIMEDISTLWYPEAPKLTQNDLDQFTLQEMFQNGSKWFSDFSNFTFIVTGDFDKNELGPKLVEKLSVFPVLDQFNDTVTKKNFPFDKMVKVIRKNNLDQAYVRLYFPIHASRDVETQVELRILAKALNKRIWNRLREGSYAPRASGDWMDINNEVFAFFIAFDSALGNEDNMISYALEEFRKLKKVGVDQEWFEKAIADEISIYEARFGSFEYFNFWAEYLQTKFKNDENLEREVLEYGTMLEHFTSFGDINVAAEKYLSEENLQKFIMLPEGYQEVNEVE